MKFPAVYGILVGMMMLAQWMFFLGTGQVPELQSEPYRIAFHLTAEFGTAIGILISGIGILRRASWSKTSYLVCTGMLIYSVIASPGYFAQQGQWALVVMFAMLLILAIASVLLLACNAGTSSVETGDNHAAK